MSEHRSGSFRLAPLRRRAPILIAVIVLVPLVAYLVAGLRSSTYTGEAIVLVPSGAHAGDPGRADEAVKLAATYALAIPQDTRVRASVAQQLGVSTLTARRHMAVVNDAETAIVRLRYTASSQAMARDGANAMLRAVLKSPRSHAIPRGSLVVVRPPDRPSRKDIGTVTPLLVGIVAGVLLAFILLVGLERSDPRIDDLDELAAEAGCPVSAVDKGVATALVAVVERWRQLAGKRGPRVALLPCSPRASDRARELAQMLAGAGRDSEEGDAGEELVVSAGGVPGAGGAGENIALHSDLTALVVTVGTRVAVVRRAVDILGQFGVTPVWMFLVPPRKQRARPGVVVQTSRVSDRGPAEA